MHEFSLNTYYPIFLYLGLLIAFAIGILIVAHLIGPRRNSPVKLMVYESGMDPIGDARQRFDIKFYMVAIMFLVFDVELLFLYPWAVVAYPPKEGDVAAERIIPEILKLPVFVGVLTFIALLLVGYAYDWRKGVFKWR